MTERELFVEAFHIEDPVARRAYLQSANVDPSLRRRVELLLDRHHNDHARLERRPHELIAALSDSTLNPSDPTPTHEISYDYLKRMFGPTDRADSLGRIGHYDILKMLGHGGFGIVVKAYDNSLHRPVAIKFLNPALAATSTSRERFLREARSAARITHEHVVRVHAVEEHPVPYLVMEYVAGQTLQEYVKANGPLAPKDVAEMGRQIALGLEAAHEQNLIHRDIKPANVLLVEGSEIKVKLTDFGLARAADDASITQSGLLAGTPQYMAPEQANGEKLNTRSDLFSLGSLLYTALAGKPAFRASSALAVLKLVAEETPQPLPEINRDIPPGLVAVIDRLQAKRPEDRFATARDVADSLGRCLTESQPFPVQRSGPRVNVTYVSLIALLAVIVGVVATIRPFLRRSEAESTPPTKPVLISTTGTILVTSTLDDGSPGTLRWAINEANTRQGEDTIAFDPTVFSTPQVITLTRGPLIMDDLSETTILGPPAGVTISANKKSQVFIIGNNAGARASISNLTIAHGRATGGRDANDKPYGAWLGGGVYCARFATITMTGCTICDNESLVNGGGGGGIFNHESTLTLINCTFARNKSFEGGGVKTYVGTTKIHYCTFAENSATQVGQSVWHEGHNETRTDIFNSLFADLGNRVVYPYNPAEMGGDYNLTVDDTAPGENSIHHLDPKLGKFGRHGGPTETYPLLPESPAINAGNMELAPPSVKTDQRGQPRVINGKVDIGAYEVSDKR
ncbi:MAG: serine/threonine-protein kinase [Gemmataceae bacterium]